MLGTAQVARPIHDQPLCADALDAGAHLGQEAAQVLDVRLARRIEDLGLAVRGHRGQQDVLGPRHGGQVEHDTAAAEPLRRGDDLVLRLVDLRAHLPQRPQVLLDPARADIVSARTGHPGVTETRDESAEQDDRRAHAAAELVGHVCLAGRAGVDDDRAFT